MITIRKTAAQRQFESFLSAVREFGCNSNEGQFERTLVRLVAADREMRCGEMQPSRSECAHESYLNAASLHLRPTAVPHLQRSLG